MVYFMFIRRYLIVTRFYLIIVKLLLAVSHPVSEVQLILALSILFNAGFNWLLLVFGLVVFTLEFLEQVIDLFGEVFLQLCFMLG